MSPYAEVRVTVLDPSVEERPPERTGVCRLLVESCGALPRPPYAGTVRVGGVEETATGAHPCRLLRHFAVEFLEPAPRGALYRVRVDLSDEWPPAGGYRSPSRGPDRRLAEPAAVIFARVAAVFGRHCETYRLPSVVVRYEP
jgi:hypothetical protein